MKLTRLQPKGTIQLGDSLMYTTEIDGVIKEVVIVGEEKSYTIAIGMYGSSLEILTEKEPEYVLRYQVAESFEDGSVRIWEGLDSKEKDRVVSEIEDRGSSFDVNEFQVNKDETEEVLF